MTVVKETSLLIEGITSYPKALGALNEFGRLVISTIRETVVEELGSLSTAVGLRLTENDLGDYLRPNRLGSFDPKNVSVGVKVDRISESGWSLYFVLFWSKAGASLSVSIWPKDGDVAKSAFTAFQKGRSKGICLMLAANIHQPRARPEAAEQLPVILRELIGDFSKCWIKAGGLQKFMKPKAAMGRGRS